MALSNSKPNVLPFSALLIIFFSLLLSNVSSQSYSPSVGPPLFPPVPEPIPAPGPTPSHETETTSFGFSFFEPDEQNLNFAEDTSVSAGVIHLTKRDYSGNPLPYSVGLAYSYAPIHLWDKTTGNLADFTTTFSFVVNPKGATLHGDGLAFFMLSVDYMFPEKNYSSGGYLGLFSPETAFDPSKNQVLAIEFDTYANEWDMIRSPHVGIDISSIRSVENVPWPSSSEPGGAIVHASIDYDSQSKTLSVSFGYDASRTLFSHVVDLRTVLPEWVLVGFSGATGALVERHDILSWSFDASL